MNPTPDPIELLIVEDDDGLRETLRLEFEDRGYRVSVAASMEDTVALLAAGVVPRFAVVDLRVGVDSGVDIIEVALAVAPGMRAIILTGYGSLTSAVSAVKRGAVNYLAKPVAVERLERALWTDDPDPRDIAAPDGRESLALHEREYIEYVLLQCGGNVSKAARWLGIHRQSLQRKLRKFRPA